MNEKLNARSTTYRVADDVVYNPRQGDVFRMGDYWEYVVLGRVVVDGFDCVKFRSVVGETRTEWTINLNEWIDRCIGKEIERQIPHHVRDRRVLHVAQFPCKASESGDHRAADEASGKLADQMLDDVLVLLAGQKYPTPERGYRTDGGWSLALADLGRCFAELRFKLATAEDERDRALAWIENMERIRIGLEAERDAARAEADKLRGEVRDLVAFGGKIDCLSKMTDEIYALQTRNTRAEYERDRMWNEWDAAREALRKIAAVTNQLGPDRASSQYMAEQAHDIASAFLANAKPGGVGQ